jgi:hypothetical protein
MNNKNNNKYFFIYKITQNKFKMIYYDIFTEKFQDIINIKDKNIILIVLDINFQPEDFIYCLNNFSINEFIFIEDLLLLVTDNYILINLQMLLIFIKKDIHNNIIFLNFYFSAEILKKEISMSIKYINNKDFMFLIGNRNKTKINKEKFFLKVIIFFNKYTIIFITINFIILLINIFA